MYSILFILHTCIITDVNFALFHVPSVIVNLLYTQVLDNQVVMVRRREKEGYDALQIGAVEHDKIKRVSGGGRVKFVI